MRSDEPLKVIARKEKDKQDGPHRCSREREERERERERDTHTHTQRQRQKQRETESDRERQRERDSKHRPIAASVFARLYK